MAGSTWKKEETLKLIALWGEEQVQAQLEGCRSNRQVYEKIANEMRAAKFDRTYLQCREKIKKLKAEYRAIVNKKHRKTGEGRTDWEFFDPLDEILGHKPATHPPVVIDALGDELAICEPEKDSSIAEGDTQPPVSPDFTTTGSGTADGHANTSSSSVASNQAGVAASGPSESKGADKKPVSSGKKKRKAEKVEAIMHDLLDKVVESNKASELRLIELEEKRMKLEEQQLEREDRRQHEEREFQMQLLQMFMGSCQGVSPRQEMPMSSGMLMQLSSYPTRGPQSPPCYSPTPESQTPPSYPPTPGTQTQGPYAYYDSNMQQ